MHVCMHMPNVRVFINTLTCQHCSSSMVCVCIVYTHTHTYVNIYTYMQTWKEMMHPHQQPNSIMLTQEHTAAIDVCVYANIGMYVHTYICIYRGTYQLLHLSMARFQMCTRICVHTGTYEHPYVSMTRAPGTYEHLHVSISRALKALHGMRSLLSKYTSKHGYRYPHIPTARSHNSLKFVDVSSRYTHIHTCIH